MYHRSNSDHCVVDGGHKGRDLSVSSSEVQRTSAEVDKPEYPKSCLDNFVKRLF